MPEKKPETRTPRVLAPAIIILFMVSFISPLNISTARAQSVYSPADQYEDIQRKTLESLTGNLVDENTFKIVNDGEVPARVTHVIYKLGAGTEWVPLDPDIDLLPRQSRTRSIQEKYRGKYSGIGVYSARGVLYSIYVAGAGGAGEGGTTIEGQTEPGAPVTVVVHPKTRVYHVKASDEGDFKIAYVASPRGSRRKVKSGVWELEPYAPGQYEVPEDWLEPGSHRVKVIAGDANRNEIADPPDKGGWIGFKERGEERELKRNEHNYFELSLKYDPLDVKLSKKNILEQGDEYLSTKAQNRLLSGRLERKGKASFSKNLSVIERMRKFAEKKLDKGRPNNEHVRFHTQEALET